jgi:competence protein ComGC
MPINDQTHHEEEARTRSGWSMLSIVIAMLVASILLLIFAISELNDRFGNTALGGICLFVGSGRRG